MISLFDYTVSFIIVIIQTSVFQYFSCSSYFFDISIPFILFLSLKRPFAESLFIIIFLGFFADSFSSGPFGIYETAYLWFFIYARWTVKFFHTDTYLLLSAIIASGILLENIIFWGATLMQGKNVFF